MLFSIQFQNKEMRMLLLVLTFFSFAFLLVSLRFWFFHSPSFITFPHIFQSFAISSSLIVFIFSFFLLFIIALLLYTLLYQFSSFEGLLDACKLKNNMKFTYCSLFTIAHCSNVTIIEVFVVQIFVFSWKAWIG